MGKIIFITIDCARQDAIFGDDIKTPNIDKLKMDGAAFTEAFSQSSATIPSIFSFFTSLYPSDQNIFDNYNFGSIPSFILPKYLQERNWKSVALCGTEFIATRLSGNFDESHKISPKLLFIKNRLLKILWASGGLKIFKNLHLRKVIRFFARKVWQIEFINAERLTNLAIQNIYSADKSDDLFIWLHFFDAHMPYYAPRKYISHYIRNKKQNYLERSNNINNFVSMKNIEDEIYDKSELILCMARYDAALTYVDDNIGRLIGALKEAGEYDDCMIVLSADHGENMVENGTFCNHIKLFDETTKVPLIIKFPANLFNGHTCEHLVELVDVYPTILSQFGISPPPQIRGMNLIPYLNGTARMKKHYVIAEHMGNFQKSIRDCKWQLIMPMPSHEWRFTIKANSKWQQIAESMQREGSILLSRKHKSRNNWIDQFPETAQHLKNMLEGILKKKNTMMLMKIG